MIKYALHCSHDHEFEVWFNSMSAFEDQKRDGLLRCPVCDDSKIEKSLMAPSVVTTKAKSRLAPTEPHSETGSSSPSESGPSTVKNAPPGGFVPVASAPPPARFVEMMRELRSFVEANTEDVGKGFAEEARKIHYEETETRAIRGEATRDEITELLEEGVEVSALPRLPEDQN